MSIEFEMKALLRPESVAIIGASENPARIGGRLLFYLSKHGYKGNVCLVNPKYKDIKETKCYSTILDFPYPIDCALIAVPGKNVFTVLNECADHNVKSAIIFSAGFAEIGDHEKQAGIKRLAAERNIRLCGPNCVGLINFHDGIALSFSQFLDIETLIPGNIALISQSGALGGSLLNRAQDRKIGFSYFISSGNEADLELSDYIKNLILHDEQTAVIAALIEGFKDGSKFVEVAELALKRQKPLIVLKIGETATGKKAAASHTGALSGSDSVVENLFRQKGIIRVRHYDELIETASLFSKGQRPNGNRVGILTTTGGGGIVMADYYAKFGLATPEPSQKTKEVASKEIPSFTRVSNPFDLTAQLINDPRMFQKCLRLFLEDDNFDIVQINNSMTGGKRSEIRALDILSSAEGSKKPIVTWWAAGSLSQPAFNVLDGSKVTLFKSPDRCARAVKKLVEYYDRIKLCQDIKVTHVDRIRRTDLDKARRILASEDVHLSESQSKTLLQIFDIDVTRQKVAKSREEAIKGAEEIGYPIALKIDSPDIPHKNKAKAVKLNIAAADQIESCYHEIIANAKRYNPNARINGVLVQEMVHNGIETIVGMSQDPQFGPVILFGLGGSFVEVMNDFSMRVVPLERLDAELLIRETKAFQILSGRTGTNPSDVEAVIDTLVKISNLAQTLKDYISEIDINPLMVLEKGYGVKAVDALVVKRRPSQNE